MTQENRQGLDQLMKAFDAAEAAQKHFAASGNIEGAQIAQQASNKIYLSMEAAMRTCKRSQDVEEFASGGRVRGTYTFAVYTRDDFGDIDPSSRMLVKQRASGPEAARDAVKKKYPGFTYFVEREMGDGGMVEDYGTGGMMSEADYYASGGNMVEVDDKYMDMDADDMDMDDEFVEVEEDEMFRDGGQIELPL